MAEPTLIAIGADGARGGWVAACLYGERAGGEVTPRATELQLCEDVSGLAELHDRAGAEVSVAIDVPIGLPSTVGFRRCDEEARGRLGKLRNSVFMPPARYMLSAAGDYADIRRLVQRERETNPAAKGLSAQAAGLTKKIAEVDRFVRERRDSEEWLWECHPELSFSALNGGVPRQDKHRAAGVVERLRLIRQEFHDAEDQLALAPWSHREAALSDMLDAYAALTTAVRCALGKQEELGNGERDEERLPMRMAV